MAVVCTSLISCFHDMLLRYCLYHLQTVPVPPAITGILLRYCLYHLQTVPVPPAITGILLRYCLYHLQTVPVPPAITGMLFRYCLSHFQTVPVASAITGITFACTFYIRLISIVKYSYFKISSASLLIAFLSQDFAASVNMHVPCSLSRIMIITIIKIFRSAPTCLGSQTIHHQAALYSVNVHDKLIFLIISPALYKAP